MNSKKNHPLVLLWPGFADSWRFGTVKNVAITLAFAGLLEFAILCTFVWPQWTVAPVRAVVWFGVVMFWMVTSGVQFLRHLVKNRSSGITDSSHKDLFRAAQTEYLNGNWAQAEELFHGLLKGNPLDVDSRLYLASLYRHVDQPAAARSQLKLLRDEIRSNGDAKWDVEVQRELSLLDQMQESTDLTTQSPNSQAA